MSIKKIVLGLTLIGVMLVGLVSTGSTFAADITTCPSGQTLTGTGKDAYCKVNLPGAVTTDKTVDASSLQNTLIGFANVLIGLVAIVSVFFIIWGAIQWMNEGAEKGQKTVVNAVIGLVIAVLAFFIVQLATGAAGFLQTQVK
jgi:Type IV secretion system pilin